MGTNPRYDLNRRERIIDACLDVIAERGVRGTSHRRVAAAAGVPLGSTTYYFTGIDDLLRAAFLRFSERAAARVERLMAQSSTASEADEAVIRLIAEVYADQRDLILTHELYTLAARDARFREVTHEWMRRSRVAFGRHFDPVTVRLLDAVIEGLSVQQALAVEPVDPAIAAEGVRRILSGAIRATDGGEPTAH